MKTALAHGLSIMLGILPLILVARTDGQGPGGKPNPWKGAPPAGAPNPLAGTPTLYKPNYLTGRPGAPPLNPYTGRPMAPPPAPNPLLGAPGSPPPSPIHTLPGRRVPVTGKAGPGLEPLDDALLKILDHHGIPGATLAITKDGKLVYAKGLGWANLGDDTPVDPLTLFGLASCSKPITALAILALCDQGSLDLDARVVDLLRDLEPPRGRKRDPRLSKVTVRHCLNHSGGWDRNKSGDPMNQCPQIARFLGVPMPLKDYQFASFMFGQPLDFEPGTQMQYSNVGYVLLGLVIEKVSGQTYEQFVQEKVLKPAGVHRAYINKGTGRYLKGEACSYLAGTTTMLPPMDVRTVQAAGGWIMTATDLVRVLSALDGSRGKGMLTEKTFKLMLAPPPPPLTKRKDGTHPGLGWPTVYLGPKGTYGYFHDGQFHGMRTFMKRNERGVNWALLFNVTMQPDQVDAQLLRQAVEEVRRQVDAIGTYPDVDFFKEF